MAMAMTVATAPTPANTSARWSMTSIRAALPPLKFASVRISPRTTKSSLVARSHVALAPEKPLMPFGFSDQTSFGSGLPRFVNGSHFRFVVVGMRHGRKVPKLNRPPDQRKALIRGLTTQLLKHGRIKTTRARASAIRKFVDKMITLAKDGSLHKRRQALAFVYEKQIVSALFAEAPERYGERNGGYTRIIRTLPRKGDNAPMAFIELV